MKKVIAAALVALTTSAFAYTVTGFLQGQYQGKSAGGQMGTVCVYGVNGKEAHIFIGYGVCPTTMEFQQ